MITSHKFDCSRSTHFIWLYYVNWSHYLFLFPLMSGFDWGPDIDKGVTDFVYKWGKSRYSTVVLNNWLNLLKI